LRHTPLPKDGEDRGFVFLKIHYCTVKPPGRGEKELSGDLVLGGGWVKRRTPKKISSNTPHLEEKGRYIISELESEDH